MSNGHYIDKYGRQYWFQNDKLHRLDGPAYIRGNKQQWWIEGKLYTKEQFDQKIKEMTNHQQTNQKTS